MKPQPSEELLQKVRDIAFYKSRISLAHRGEFNKFGVYVQSKDIYEQDVSKTIYMAGGKFIPKLKFTVVTKGLPLEVPFGLFEDLDMNDPDYEKKHKERYDRYLDEGGFLKEKVIINKYEPGDWEHKLDLLDKFTQEFAREYIGKDLP